MTSWSEMISRAAFIGAAAMLLCVMSMVALTGCGSDRGGENVTYTDVGMRMNLPPGWSQDRFGLHSQRGHRDDHHGMVYTVPLEAGTLDAHLAAMPDADHGLRSRERTEVDGHEAIELITDAAYSLYEVYILRGDEVVVVSFRTLPEAFDDQLSAFRGAARSIRFD